jgi:exonuclease III
MVALPTAMIEVHTAHVPPGSSNGWLKVDTFRGIYRRLACPSLIPRVLCGDFNSPQRESVDGKVITWGQHEVGGQSVYRGTFRGGTGMDWDAAERSVLEGLAEFDLIDAFRTLHGYGVQEYSWYLKRKGVQVGRRFDHIFASRHFNVRACRYVHELRASGLSDHSPIEVDLEVHA